MYDILHGLLDRLEKQAVELGRETEKRVAAERQVERIGVSGHDVVAMIEHMATDRKIEAIKLYRQMTGYGLKESKDAIERVTDRFRPRDAAA